MANRDGESPYRDIGPSKPELLEYRVRELERRVNEIRAELKSLWVEHGLLKDRVLGVEVSTETNERQIARTQRHAEWTWGQWIFVGVTLLTSILTLAAVIITAAHAK
jgi:hypothetical protein